MKIRSANIILTLALFCTYFLSFSQNDEWFSLLKSSDDDVIKIENHYYEALKYKAIGNYTRAITELEKCQQLLLTDEPSVDFEFSKNYFFLTKYNEAALYIEKSLKEESTNYWYLEQAKKVYLKQYNYPRAIEIQRQIIELKPEKKEDLVLIYLLSNNKDSAQNLIDELNSKGITSRKLRNYQKSLINYRNRNAVQKVVVTKKLSIDELKKSFETEKQFDVLKEILQYEYSNENQKELAQFSEEGMELFPAQPFVYLMKGKSLFFYKKYNDAIDVLNSGIDFIVDDKLLEAAFYEQLAKNYDALNQTKKAVESREKSTQLKQP